MLAAAKPRKLLENFFAIDLVKVLLYVNKISNNMPSKAFTIKKTMIIIIYSTSDEICRSEGKTLHVAAQDQALKTRYYSKQIMK